MANLEFPVSDCFNQHGSWKFLSWKLQQAEYNYGILEHIDNHLYK